MTKYKNQKIVRCQNIKELKSSYRLIFGADKEKAFKICQHPKVKDKPYALTTENNRYYLWI